MLKLEAPVAELLGTKPGNVTPAGRRLDRQFHHEARDRPVGPVCPVLRDLAIGPAMEAIDFGAFGRLKPRHGLSALIMSSSANRNMPETCFSQLRFECAVPLISFTSALMWIACKLSSGLSP